MVSDLELIRDLSLMDGRKLVIWGAGNNGMGAWMQIRRMFYPERYAELDCRFCDSNPEKWSGNANQIGAVISPERLKEEVKRRETLILVASDRQNEILEQIESMGLPDSVMVCTWFALQMAVHFHIQDEMFTEAYRAEYKLALKFNLELIRTRHVLGKVFVEKTFFCDADERKIYVLQPGKVGSTTVSLGLAKKGIPYVHMHRLTFLDAEGPEEYRRMCRESFDALRTMGGGGTIKIITLVREPISRDISCFWQLLGAEKLLFSGFAKPDLMKFFHRFIEYAYGEKEKLAEIPPCARGYIKWGDQGEWFSETIERYFGVDVFAYPFDAEKGYSIIRQGNVHLLILQMEKMDRLTDVIGDFAGLRSFEMTRENDARGFGYYPAYQEFCKKIVLDRSYVNACCESSPFLRHFYSEKDRQVFFKKWEGKTAQGCALPER